MGKKLEEFKDLLTDPEYAYYLHGTGGDGMDKVASIFENGLRASHNSMFFTTVCYGDGDTVKNNWEQMHNDMNHWPHKDSKNIVVVRFPKKYLILGADENTGEKDYAIYNEVTDPETNHVTRYINPKMIVGCYHAKNGNFTLNPYCEQELSSETEKNMQVKYEQGVKLFEERKKSDDKPYLGTTQQEEKKDEKDSVEEFELGDWD